MASPSRKTNKPVTPRNGVGWLAAGVFLGFSLVATYYMQIATASAGVGDKMAHITEISRFPETGIALRTTYTGIALVDKGLSFLVSAFIHGAAAWDRGSYLQQIYFLVSFFSVITIWTIESCRKRNSFALISFTSIWAIFYQTVGGAIIIPLQHLAYLWDTSESKYWVTESARVPLPYAKAMLPALVLGYLVPTVLIFLPYSDENLWKTQGMVAFWQPCPWYVDALLWGLSKFYTASTAQDNETKAPFRDVDYLGPAYTVAILVPAVTHVGTMLVCLLSNDPQHSFSHVFIPGVVTEETNLTEALLWIFQIDFWIIFASSLAWVYLAIWDLKRTGATDVSLTRAGIAILVGTITVGPGATLAGIGYWREHAMAKDSTDKPVMSK